MSGKKVTPDTRFVKFFKGQRYMINIATAGKHGAAVYPFSQKMMDENKDLVEIFPKFEEDETTVEEEITLEPSDIDMTEPIVIDDVVVKYEEPVANAVPDEDEISEHVDPRFANLEKARAARKAKK